jgi:hypothetical protein
VLFFKCERCHRIWKGNNSFAIVVLIHKREFVPYSSVQSTFVSTYIKSRNSDVRNEKTKQDKKQQRDEAKKNSRLKRVYKVAK